jgi:membrane protein YdbS with pleckstrin-like domain
MSNTSETPDHVVANSDEQFAIPIDRNAAKKYCLVQNFIIALVALVFGVAPLAFVLIMSLIFFLLAGNGFIIGVIGVFCSTGFLLLFCAGYFFFAKWLVEHQVEALNFRIEGQTLRVDYGFIFLKRKSIPLDRVTDFGLVQGPVMRMLGIWALQVQTASTGTNIPEATLIAIENPEKVRDELLRRRDEATRGNRRDYC